MVYQDIAHNDPSAVLWVLENNRITCFPAGEDIHESIWGHSVINRWRGRNCKKSGLVSIMPPMLFCKSPPPPWLIEKLRAKFDGKIMYFNFLSPGGIEIK